MVYFSKSWIQVRVSDVLGSAGQPWVVMYVVKWEIGGSW